VNELKSCISYCYCTVINELCILPAVSAAVSTAPVVGSLMRQKAASNVRFVPLALSCSRIKTKVRLYYSAL